MAVELNVWWSEAKNDVLSVPLELNVILESEQNIYIWNFSVFVPPSKKKYKTAN